MKLAELPDRIKSIRQVKLPYAIVWCDTEAIQILPIAATPAQTRPNTQKHKCYINYT